LPIRFEDARNIETLKDFELAKLRIFNWMVRWTRSFNGQ
jgi:hypothetical protein